MTRFFTSDTHFGHANIIRYCDRPFASVDEMNRALVSNWNEVVAAPEDEVWHLGDFSFHHGYDFLGSLNGHKFLVAGNHDRSKTLKLPGWEKVHTGHVYLEGVYLRHVPEPNFKAHYHFHGHCHSKPAERRVGRRIDVGVDSWGFKPRTYEELIA